MNGPDLNIARTSRTVFQRALLLLVVGLVLGGTFWKTGVLGMFSSSANQMGDIGVTVPGNVQSVSENGSSNVETSDTSSSMATIDQIVGAWEFADSDASREIVNRADGTATINVTFSFVASFLYGSTLQLDLEWSLEDGVLTHTIIGGSPEAGKKALVRDYGEKTKYKILKLTDQEMHLMEFGDQAEDYLWKRSAEE